MYLQHCESTKDYSDLSEKVSDMKYDITKLKIANTKVKTAIDKLRDQSEENEREFYDIKGFVEGFTKSFVLVDKRIEYVSKRHHKDLNSLSHVVNEIRDNLKIRLDKALKVIDAYEENMYDLEEKSKKIQNFASDNLKEIQAHLYNIRQTAGQFRDAMAIQTKQALDEMRSMRPVNNGYMKLD